MRPRPPSPTPFPYTTLFRSPHADGRASGLAEAAAAVAQQDRHVAGVLVHHGQVGLAVVNQDSGNVDRKSTRLNSSHTVISYAVFCLKKKKRNTMMSWTECPS